MKKISILLFTTIFATLSLSSCNTSPTTCDHELEEVIIMQPTCTTSGEKANHCIKCGQYFDKEVVNPLGHDWKTTELVESTCSTHGHEIQQCQRCEETQTLTLELKEHNYKVVEVVEPTCTTDGYTLKECIDCGHQIQDDKVDHLSHDYGDTFVIAPTCTESGYSYKICKICNSKSEYFDLTDPLGHIEVIDKGYPESCTENGLTDGSHCERCHEIIIPQTVIPAKNHHYIQKQIVEPTCTEKGYTLFVCEHCQQEIKDNYVDELGHDIVTTSIAPTCLEPGYNNHQECQRCHTIINQGEDVPALGHDTYISNPYKTATCEEDGHTEEISCHRCEQVITSSTIIPATGHKYVKTGEKASSCQEEGYIEYTCSHCQDVKKEVVKRLEHVDSNTDKLCDNCEAHLIYDTSDFKNIKNDLSGNYVLMNDLALTGSSPLGVINDDINEISIDNANPFTGTLTSNGANKILKGYTKKRERTLYAPIYYNKGIIDGVNVTGVSYSTDAVFPVDKGANKVGGLTLINEGIIKNCQYVGEDTLKLNRSLSRGTDSTGKYTSTYESYIGGFAYLNETNGSIIDCYASATIKVYDIFSLYHKGNSGLIIHTYNENDLLEVIRDVQIGAIAHTNNGEIKGCHGEIMYSGETELTLTVDDCQHAAVPNGLITYGYGNVRYYSRHSCSQLVYLNNNLIEECYSNEITNPSWTQKVTKAVLSELTNTRFPNRMTYDIARVYGPNKVWYVRTNNGLIKNIHTQEV